MKALIIDDEKHIHQGIKTILAKICPDVVVIGNAFSVQEGLESISSLAPDLVFLDIRMDDGTGFELLHQLPKPYPQIIFISAHDEYALNAFKFSAVDYLMKPLESDELKAAVERAREKQASEQLKEQLQKLNDFMIAQRERKVVLRDADQVHVVNEDDILWVSAEGSYTSFTLLNEPEPIMVSKNLREYELMLDSTHFYRVHRSFLVNCRHFVKYNRPGGFMIFTGGKQLPLSLKKEQLLALLDGL